MKKQPHIIIFNPDQWRGDVLGHMGNPAAVTPNLDRLVENEAVSFGNAFCQNPVCTPSRCSFMTGWYPHVRGHRTMYHMLHSEHGEPNLLRTLKENGYFVWWTARNDLLPGGKDYSDDGDVFYFPKKEDYQRWNHALKPGLHFDTEWRGQPGDDTYYSFYAGLLNKGDDDIYADFDWGWTLGAAEFIRNYEGDKPLCLFLAIGYPHPPYGVEEPWYSRIDRSKMPPRIPTPDGWKDKPLLLEGLQEGQNMQGWSEERWTELRATYYGQCARVDHQFGLITDALKESGMYDDSALFFFSDHGDFTGDYGLVEKTQNTFEDCLSRVPFVVKPPKEVAVKPRVSDAMVELVDFSATVFDLTGIDPGYDSFGRSLLPVLSGETEEHRNAVFCEGGRRTGEKQALEAESVAKMDEPEKSQYWPRIKLQISEERPWNGKAAMCRTQTHKYVRRLYEKDELYDLEKDPRELRNRIDDPEYAEVLAQLKERMAEWYLETCDVVPRTTDSRW
ncbi:MAG: sulfatase-like hydrolase/transferase [Proteobacteria bacterium]|nr:sulfatase-like hydrolase/transferase [Pseudomonadota bacterium]